MSDQLAIFRHHPEASIDFCIEAEGLEGWAHDLKLGVRNDWKSFWGHLSRAFRYARKCPEVISRDECAPNALAMLRGLERWLADV